MSISIDTEKAFDKIQNSFLVKNFQSSHRGNSHRENVPQHIMTILNESTVTSYSTVKS